MESRSIKYVVEAVGGELLAGSPDALAMRVCTDSRSACPGDLFFALAGERFDGHDFLAEVIRAGVAAVVVERARAPRSAEVAVELDERAAACARMETIDVLRDHRDGAAFAGDLLLEAYEREVRGRRLGGRERRSKGAERAPHQGGVDARDQRARELGIAVPEPAGASIRRQPRGGGDPRARDDDDAPIRARSLSERDDRHQRPTAFTKRRMPWR